MLDKEPIPKRGLPSPKISEVHLKYMKYRWEFLRRNKEYISDWEKLNKNESPINVTCSPVLGECTPAEATLSKKWKILRPLNPNDPFDRLLLPSERGTPEALRVLYDILFPVQSFGRPVSIIDNLEQDKSASYYSIELIESLFKDGKLQIEIDLNYSKAKISDEFEFILKYWKSIFEWGVMVNSTSNYIQEASETVINPNKIKEFLQDLEKHRVGELKGR